MIRPLLALSTIALTASLLAAPAAAPPAATPPAAAPPAAAPAAEVKTFTVDNVHSTVLFRINHMSSSYVHGRFNEISGTFSLSEAGENPVSVDMQVKAASVDTNAGKRDEHLRSASFFNVK